MNSPNLSLPFLFYLYGEAPFCTDGFKCKCLRHFSLFWIRLKPTTQEYYNNNFSLILMVGLRSPLSSSLSLQTQKNSRRLRRQRVLVLCWFFATVLFINALVPKQSSIRNESQLHSHGKNVLNADAILASLSSFNRVFGGRGRGRASSNNNNDNDEFLRLQMEKERASGTL